MMCSDIHVYIIIIKKQMFESVCLYQQTPMTCVLYHVFIIINKSCVNSWWLYDVLFEEISYRERHHRDIHVHILINKNWC